MPKNSFLDTLADVKKAMEASNSHPSAYVDMSGCELAASLNSVNYENSELFAKFKKPEVGARKHRIFTWMASHFNGPVVY